MNELRESLDQALRTVVPGEAPVGEAMRRGAAIRIRRRVTAVASVLAVALFAGVGYPALTHMRTLREPVASRHAVSVTDVPPGPGAPAGMIAHGTIGGKAWQAVTSKVDASRPGQQCVSASGPAIGPPSEPLSACGPAPASDSTPANLMTVTSGSAEASFGAVRPDVRYLVVTLSDGTRLNLIPVRVEGVRYVAFAAPLSLKVDSITAFLANGQYLTATPFNAPEGTVMVGEWLLPGQHGQPRVTRQIAAGAGDGGSWSVDAYAGPWGTCVTYPGTAVCFPTGLPLATGLMKLSGTPAGAILGMAAPAVAHVKVTFSDGSTLPLTPVAVGKQKFFAFRPPGGTTVRRWVAYDAAGKQIDSGTRPD